MYSPKTTPRIFITDPPGNLIYNGAIDDQQTSDQSGISGGKNYASQALEEALAGKPVSVATTRGYGCSVKYPDTD